MPYSIRLPDGTEVANIPDEVPFAQAKARIAQMRPELGKYVEDTSGFIPAVKAGVERLKGEAGLLAGKAGIMSLQEAERYKKEREAEASALHTPTEKGWTEAPWLKFRETLGGSVPYMAVPLAAGAAATGLGAPGLVAAGLGALASGAQFTGSNLARQMETGKSLEQADLGKAALAAIPQAALDTVSMRMIPGVGRLMGAAGVKVTAETAEAIAKQSLAKVAADYALTTGKTMTAEGLTEAAQQVFERMQAGLNLTDPEARKEYLENFIGGAVLGGAVAPVGRYMERSKIAAGVPPTPEPPAVEGQPATAPQGPTPEVPGAPEAEPADELRALQEKLVEEPATEVPATGATFPPLEEAVPEPTLRTKAAAPVAESVHPAVTPELGPTTYNWANKAGRKWVESIAAMPQEEALAQRKKLVGRSQQKADIFDAIHAQPTPSTAYVEPDIRLEPEGQRPTAEPGVEPPAGPTGQPGFGDQYPERTEALDGAGVAPDRGLAGEQPGIAGEQPAALETQPTAEPVTYGTETTETQQAEAQGPQAPTEPAFGIDQEELARRVEAAQVDAAIMEERAQAGRRVEPEAIAEPVQVTPEPTVPKPVLPQNALAERRLARLEENLTNEDYVALRQLLDTGDTASATKRMAEIEADMRNNRYRKVEAEGTAPIQHKELEDIVRTVEKSLGGNANVTIMDSVTQFDPKMAPGSRSGVMHKGQVILFRDGIKGKLEGQRTVFHELFHKGLRNILSETEYAGVMNRLYSQSADIRAKADAWLKDPENASDIEKLTPEMARAVATDEVIAEMAEDTNLKPSVVQALRNWFAALADRFGLKPLAQHIRNMGMSPMRQFIRDALKASIEGTPETQATMARKAKPAKAANPLAPAPDLFEELVATSEIGQEPKGPVREALNTLGKAFKTANEVTAVDKFRVLSVDAAASVENKLNREWDGAVRNAFGKLNPMNLYRQAQDAVKLLQGWVSDGALLKDSDTGMYYTGKKTGVPSIKEVLDTINTYAKERGVSFEQAYASLSKMFEAKRLDAFRKSNLEDGTEIPINKLSNASNLSADQQIDTALKSFAADTKAQEILNSLDKIRFSLIDNMEAVGRLTSEEAALWKESAGYIPFDRIGEFETAFKPKRRAGKGMAQLGTLPELIGAETIEVGNTIDNFIKLSGWMIQQTVRQDATLHTLRALEKIGHATFRGSNGKAADASKMVKTYVKGKEVWFELPSRWDTLAFKEMPDPKGFFVKAFEGFANVLRRTITALPPFAVKQVVEDIQRAYVTSGVQSPSQLIFPTIRNFLAVAGSELMGKQHPLVQQFERIGIIGDYDFHNSNPADSVLANLGYRARGPVKSILHRLEGITRASDLAVRAAIYERTMAETHDKALASTRAREFINFRRRGAGSAIPALTATIPFFNAYLQGMDVLYRAATGKGAAAGVSKAQARRLFMTKVSTMAAFAGIYAVMMSGDDDYNEASLQVRHGNWIFPGGFKLPVPAELAAIFKVPVEMGLEYVRRSGTPEDMEASEAAITALKFALEQYIGRVTPIPTAVKPVLEAITNHSFFTGRQLEGNFQRNIDPSQRTTASTSELAKAIAKFTSDTFGEDATISPIKIDNFLRGYFGSVAGMVTMATDQALNPDRLDRPMSKYWMLSTFMYDTEADGRRIDEFYNERDKVAPKLATLSKLKDTDPEAAVAYIQANEQALILAQAIGATTQKLSQLRQYRNMLSDSAYAIEMSQEERRSQLNEIRKYEVELVSWLREVKKHNRTQ